MKYGVSFAVSFVVVVVLLFFFLRLSRLLLLLNSSKCELYTYFDCRLNIKPTLPFRMFIIVVVSRMSTVFPLLFLLLSFLLLLFLVIMLMIRTTGRSLNLLLLLLLFLLLLRLPVILMIVVVVVALYSLATIWGKVQQIIPRLCFVIVVFEISLRTPVPLY